MTGSLPVASTRAVGTRVVRAVLLAALVMGTTVGTATAQETSTPADDQSAAASDQAVVLDVDLVDDVDEVVAHDRRSYTYTITVANGGTAAASEVSMADELPASLSVTGVRAPGPWTCVLPTQQVVRDTDEDASSEPTTHDELYCTLETLAAGTSAPPLTVDVQVADDFSGQVDYRVQANSAGSEPAEGTETTMVAQQPPAQLAVDVVDDVEDTVPHGGADFAYTVTVGNPGPVELTEVSVADQLPAGLTVTGVAAPGPWTCVLPSDDGNEQLYCVLDTLAAGGSAPPLTIDVVTADDLSGRLENVVEADSAETDPVRATETTTVDVATQVLGNVLEKPTSTPAPQVLSSVESSPELAATGPWADHLHLAWLAILALGLGMVLLRTTRSVTAER